MNGRELAVMALLGAAALGALVLAVSTGPYPVHIPPGDDPVARTIFYDIRLPRALCAALAGAALALAGAVTQGLFRNPLADPGVVGVSGGGALGAILALHFGLGAAHVTAVPACAFLGALAAAALVAALSAQRGGATVTTFLLAGVAVASLTGAISALVLSLTTEYLLREMTFWLMGGLDARSWAHVHMAAPFILTGMGAALLYARELDLLSQGDDAAASSGVPVRRTRAILILCVAGMTGAAVAISGIIGFVGLVVPHIVRLLQGPRHRALLVNSALGGAALLILADLLARSLAPHTEIRLGILTSLVGVPFFLVLLRRRRGMQNYA